MNLEIYQNNSRINIEESSVVDFTEELNAFREDLNELMHDFLSIHYLKGDKELLEKAFQHQKKESINP